MIESKPSKWSEKTKLYRWVCPLQDCLTAGAQTSGAWVFSISATRSALKKHMKKHD